MPMMLQNNILNALGKLGRQKLTGACKILAKNLISLLIGIVRHFHRQRPVLLVMLLAGGIFEYLLHFITRSPV